MNKASPSVVFLRIATSYRVEKFYVDFKIINNIHIHIHIIIIIFVVENLRVSVLIIVLVYNNNNIMQLYLLL